MSAALEIIGSTIIFGVLILLVVELNIFVLETNAQTVLEVSTQERVTGYDDAAGASRILEYDLLKIGYRCTVAPAISYADSERIHFYCDLNNDGTLDSVKYYVGDATTVRRDENTRLRNVIRRVNWDPVNAHWLEVSQFRFAYLDQKGKNLPTPVPSTLLPSVRSISIQMTVESRTRLQNSWDQNFAGVHWQSTISPANIQ